MALGYTILAAERMMDQMEEWEIEKDEVLHQLQQINTVQLSEICGTLDIVVPVAWVVDLPVIN